MRSRFSSYFHTAELQSKLVLAFLLIAEMPHCQKVNLLLQLLHTSGSSLEGLIDSLTELASRVLPFVSIPLGKAYELHHYIASLTRARTIFRKQCVQELSNLKELRHKLLTVPSLKALVSSTALRRKLWAIHNAPAKLRQPASSRNSHATGNAHQRVSFEDLERHSPKEASRMTYSEISTITSE